MYGVTSIYFAVSSKHGPLLSVKSNSIFFAEEQDMVCMLLLLLSDLTSLENEVFFCTNHPVIFTLNYQSFAKNQICSLLSCICHVLHLSAVHRASKFSVRPGDLSKIQANWPAESQRAIITNAMSEASRLSLSGMK